MKPAWRWLFAAGGFLATLPGFLIRAAGAQDAAWSVGGCALGAALATASADALFAAPPGTEKPAVRAAAGLLMCVLSSLAQGSLEHPSAAFAAVFLSIIAVRCLGSVKINRRRVGSAAGLIACGLDATALTLPIGSALASLGWRRDRWRSILWLSACLAVTVGSAVAGAPVFSARRFTGAVHFFERDVAVMLTPIILGLAGWAGVGAHGRPRLEANGPSAWTLVSLAGLAAGLLGAPVTLPIVLLPLWYGLPAALAALTRSAARPEPPGLGRLVPLGTLILLALLLWGPLMQWSGLALAAIMLLPLPA
ncbi:MAG: hypothetical protein AMXMBFR83_04050 [Phycisphaerae bacterium]